MNKQLKPQTLVEWSPPLTNDAPNNDPPPDERSKVKPNAKTLRFVPTWLDDIVLRPDPVYLIDGVLPLGPSLGVVFGPPGSFKSFFLANMLLHVAAGRPFCGRAVQSGAVLYLTSEGVTGAERRLIAMRQYLGLSKAPFGLITKVPNFGTGIEDRNVLIADIKAMMAGLNVPLRTVAIDTLRRAMPGKAENKTEDMGVFIDNCGAISNEFGCLTIAVHHSPRSDDTRASGANALDGATDVMIGVARIGKTMQATVAVTRLKDGPDGDAGAAFSFRVLPREVGADGDGKTVMSCVVEAEPLSELPPELGADKPKQDKVSAVVKTFRDSFFEALNDFGQAFRVRGDGPEVRAVDLKMVREEFKRRYATGVDGKKKRDETVARTLRRVIGDLPSEFKTEVRGDHEWIWKV
jgi:hypothetical protein